MKKTDGICKKFVNSSGGDIAKTLDASYYKGQGFRQGTEREYIVIILEKNPNEKEVNCITEG